MDIGAPNVRECSSQPEQKALHERAARAARLAERKGGSHNLNCFSDYVEKRSTVTVSMPASIARFMTSDPKSIYRNYEALVGSGLRHPATAEHDRERHAVAGSLFGFYQAQIIYGVLSLSGAGLPSYGDVSCSLRSVAIEDRVSFLETNSFAFVAAHNTGRGSSPPAGFRSVWGNRHELAVAKHGASFTKDTNSGTWQQILVSSGQDRSSDDFIEAHIFDSFDGMAIEQMIATPGRRRSRDADTDIRLALEQFARLRS